MPRARAREVASPTPDPVDPPAVNRPRLLLRAALLGGIPLVVMSAIGAYLLASGQTADGRSTLAVGVIVAATAAGSLLYQVEGWSLTRGSVTHFALMLVTVLPALLLSGWFPVDTAGGVLAVVGIFLAAGLVLWTTLYLVMTAVERRRTARAAA
jgi:FtsH-binding integral membrane protein